MKRIVIVDDDEDIAFSMKLILTASGYDVSTYANAQQLLQDRVTPPPDLYLIDKQMPGMDGLELCRWLKSQPSTMHIPVVMISATPGIRRLAEDAGAADTVEKPYSGKGLKEVIGRVLSSRQLDTG
jgi:DNA-binding response OmpR family regulator